MKPLPEEFRDEHIPIGYLITIRAYGTWLHGSQGSVDRFHNTYGTPRLPANEKRREYNRRLLAQRPVSLRTNARKAVESGIRETCDIRKWTLWAINVRTNHFHTVVSANCRPRENCDRVQSKRNAKNARGWHLADWKKSLGAARE